MSDETYTGADGTIAAAFATFGDPVDAVDVPALVAEGIDVWSYGYGDDDGDEFTTIEASDLWAFKDARVNGDASVVESWAPFRVDPRHVEHVREHGADASTDCRYCAALRTF